jgi:hypothetical protein
MAQYAARPLASTGVTRFKGHSERNPRLGTQRGIPVNASMSVGVGRFHRGAPFAEKVNEMNPLIAMALAERECPIFCVSEPLGH